MYFRLPLPLLIPGEAGSMNDGGIRNGVLPQLLLLQTVAECQDGGGIRNVVCDRIDSRLAADAGNINQLILHGRIAEGIPVLHQVNG